MLNKGIRKKLEYENGKYNVDIDITTEEWLEMLNNKEVFDEKSINMILAWYEEEGHQATSKTIMKTYYPELKSSPYNGIVKGLSIRILKHLNNRFYVESNESEKKESFWSIPFEGWHVDYDEFKPFVWKVRPELVDAIYEYLKNNKELSPPKQINFSEMESLGNVKDGKKIMRYTTVYERKSQNRDAAIKINKQKYGKLICEVCNFNFEETYGERGKDFIEVHHNKPLSESKQEVEINPIKDLNCLCSNCHRIIHRNKSETLTVEQLKKIIWKNKKGSAV